MIEDWSRFVKILQSRTYISDSDNLSMNLDIFMCLFLLFIVDSFLCELASRRRI